MGSRLSMGDLVEPENSQARARATRSARMKIGRGVALHLLIVADHIDPLLYDYYRPERFPTIDLILACGDLKQWYMSYLMSTFNAPLYYVRGNHDLSFHQDPPEGGEDIHGRLISYRGIRIMALRVVRYTPVKQCNTRSGRCTGPISG